MELVGKIIQVLPPQEGVGRNGNPWKLQGYVLETLEQYPRKVHFEVFGEDRIRQNPCEIDQLVTISFDIESREFNGRWYTSIRAWRINQGDTTQAAAAAIQIKIIKLRSFCFKRSSAFTSGTKLISYILPTIRPFR